MRRALLIVPLAALAVLALVAIGLGRGGAGGRAGAAAGDGTMTVVRGRLVPPIDGSGYSLFLRFRPPDAPADGKDPLSEPVLHIKTACRVGDRVMADNGLWMPHHHDEDLPDDVDENLAFSGTPLPARPDRCEVAIRLYQGLTPTDQIHRSCLAGGETATDGPCDPPVVDHPLTGNLPIVSDVTASYDEYGLVVGWTVTGAGRPDPNRNVRLTGTCGAQAVETGCSPDSGELEPGDSMHCAEIVAPKGSQLDRCELRFADAGGGTPGAELGTFCASVGGGPAPPGPCR